MRAEIISIGTELLLGSIVNTNARFLSEKLAEQAIDVYHQVTVGDNLARIVQAFETAAKRSDILIVSGGLGPTEDDVTAKALSQFLGRPLVYDAATHRHIARRMQSHHLSMTRLVDRQSYIPKGSTPFQNDEGTAPGLLGETSYEDKKVWVLVLPGPPRELEPMFEKKALPELMRHAAIGREHFLARSIKITGVTEAEVARKVSDILRMKPPLTAGIYARPGEVEIKIMAKSDSKKRAAQMAARLEKTLRKRLGNIVFGVDEQTLASEVGRLLKKRDETLAAAESCTGGLFSGAVTEVPGSSRYFLGGVICYDDRVKTLRLDVPADVIKKHGAVSAVVAKKMAAGVRKKLGADWGVGITGIAGPSGGTRSKPVGLVYIALSGPKDTRIFKNHFYGKRKNIRARSVDRALNLLRLALT